MQLVVHGGGPGAAFGAEADEAASAGEDVGPAGVVDEGEVGDGGCEGHLDVGPDAGEGGEEGVVVCGGGGETGGGCKSVREVGRAR